MKLITTDDIIDIYYRLSLKGLGFLGSKLTFNPMARTYSSFNSDEMLTCNWWNIPAVRNRWNEKISGDSKLSYADYVFNKYLKDSQSLKLLSPGCGVCTNEFRFAAYPSFSEITCVDLAEKPLLTARKSAIEKNFLQMKIIKADVNKMNFPKEFYDLVMFNSSLHHFENVENLLINTISDTMKPDGLLLINEYVGPNRLQWSKKQLHLVNDLLQTRIPVKYRRRYKSRLIKNHISGPGVLRMVFSDPSEAVDSESIVPALRKGFTPLEETNLGGNILMILLKDIAHHFTGDDPQAMLILDDLMKIEDDFLYTEGYNNIFGIYRKNKK